MTPHPTAIADEAMLDDMLSTPSDALVETLAGLDGDITLLGSAARWGQPWRGWPNAPRRTNG
jgi:hypothetical protein